MLIEFLLVGHMDPQPDHFFISDGRPVPAQEEGSNKDWWEPIVYPPERQAKLRITSIIDWERAAFFPRFMIAWQFPTCCGGDLLTKDFPDTMPRPSLPSPSHAWEFMKSMAKMMSKIGEEHTETSGFQLHKPKKGLIGAHEIVKGEVDDVEKARKSEGGGREDLKEAEEMRNELKDLKIAAEESDEQA